MEIFEIIFPVLAVALVGYLSARLRFVSVQDVNSLSRFVFVILLPVFLFNSLAHVLLPERIEWSFFLAYYSVALLMYFLGMLIKRHQFNGSTKEQAIFGLGSSFGNLVLVGLPIISAVLGEQSLLPLFMLVSVHSAILFSLTTLQIQRSNHNGNSASHSILRQTLADILHNPAILALAAGLAINLARIPIPQPVDDSLALISRATLPCALFVLGASLAEFKIAGHLAEAGAIVGLKMVLHPLLVWVLVFHVFHINGLWGTVAVLAAGMPVGITTSIFANGYQAGSTSLSTAILLSTIFAVFSQPLLLYLLT